MPLGSQYCEGLHHAATRCCGRRQRVPGAAVGRDADDRTMSEIARRPVSVLRPLSPTLSVEVREWVAELRVIWAAAGLSLNQFASVHPIDELRALHEAAGSPTLATLVALARQQRPPVVLIRDSALSEWLNRQRIPGQRSTREVLVIVSILQVLAKTRGGYELRPEAWWGQLLRQAQDERRTARIPSLTPTEMEVAELLEDGLSTLEIAKQMIVSSHTVQTHVSHILKKLGVASRIDIVRGATLRSE